ncbi:vacuolar sorting protein vps29 [Tritrichomonas foetus]|uniref:Vacuolar protein sorting-associated protein 29 n=1 Tax=Tritrichomonas foetus TaxID=1144522 RepID=A0A1J4KPF3_9EUKA|nr:vacuolar sorting protein vps29 [Tritrichomonas foetus]|eukprot:OHT11590.1 vacuolar sorting protein vps29 [Tritrichomonas foetus]
MVRGEFDDDDLCENETLIVNAGCFKIGLASSYSIIPSNDKDRLATKARELDVDILCFGGGHRSVVFEADGKLFVNPGSATGAFTPATTEVSPSFVLINIQASTAQIFTYVLTEDGNMQIDKKKFTKESEEE